VIQKQKKRFLPHLLPLVVEVGVSSPKTMKGAPFLFLDEPTLGLDVESQHHIRTMLTEENQWWKAVLITTHDIPFAHAVGNKFVFIQGGKIVWSGTKEHFSTPADLETHFLAAIRSNLSV
jgi:ABC-2 type transport system ATP-binding protein